jgi:hypothetical protein
MGDEMTSTKRYRRRGMTALVSVITVAAALAAAPSAAAGVTHHDPSHGFHPVVVADGLDNPRQLALGPSGGLYIAEAGRGGPDCVGPADGQTCIGTTGAIDFVGRPRAAQVAPAVPLVTGLVSGADPTGMFAVGADGVSLTRAGRIDVQMTYAPPEFVPIPQADQLGKLLQYNRSTGRLLTVADISAYEMVHDPDGLGTDSDPYAVLSLPDGSQLVADAAGNDVLRVRGHHVSLWHVFPLLANDTQWVPVSLARDSHGRIYVGGLAGETPGKARVAVFSAGGKFRKVYSGFTTATGIAVDRQGNLWVSELFHNLGDPSAPGFDPSTVGRVTRVSPDGTRTHYPVPLPAGIVVDRAGYVYVSAWSITPGDGGFGNPDWHGQVWRFHP